MEAEHTEKSVTISIAVPADSSTLAALEALAVAVVRINEQRTRYGTRRLGVRNVSILLEAYEPTPEELSLLAKAKLVLIDRTQLFHTPEQVRAFFTLDCLKATFSPSAVPEPLGSMDDEQLESMARVIIATRTQCAF